MRRLRKVAAAALLLIAAACGGEDAPDQNKGEFCDATGVASCRRIEQCGLLHPDEPNFDACFGAFKKACCVDNGSCQQKPSDQNGFAEYVDACSKGLASAPCTNFSHDPPIFPAACSMSY